MRRFGKYLIITVIVFVIVFSSIVAASAGREFVDSIRSRFSVEYSTATPVCSPTPCPEDEDTRPQSIMDLVVYLWALTGEVTDRLFVPNSGNFKWGRAPDGQWYLVEHKLPELNPKGTDFVDAFMTAAHNIAVALAQFTTLLPSEPLKP